MRGLGIIFYLLDLMDFPKKYLTNSENLEKLLSNFVHKNLYFSFVSKCTKIDRIDVSRLIDCFAPFFLILVRNQK